jgi:sugar phosphate isomerase/epimerase
MEGSMRISRVLPVLAMIASTQAFAYDGLEADFATCTQGKDQGEIVEACTRLIDNASVENPMVGMFYGLRASNNDDRAQNCADARKSLELADDEAIKSLSQKLIDANC